MHYLEASGELNLKALKLLIDVYDRSGRGDETLSSEVAAAAFALPRREERPLPFYSFIISGPWRSELQTL